MRVDKNANVHYHGNDMRIHKLKWLWVNNKSKNILVLGNVSQVSIANVDVVQRFWVEESNASSPLRPL